MKKILITGNSGYIGSHLTKMLETDYEVYGLDFRAPQHPVKNHYHIDIRKQFAIEEEFDAVVHLAGLVNVGESEKTPLTYYITNLNGTMNVINKIKTNNFIFSSTGAAEQCLSPYGVSKRAAEDVVREFYTSHKLTPYTIFRFYNVIGSDGYQPTNPDGLMYNLMKAREQGYFTINGNDYDTVDGTCVRDYLHVNEVCDAIRTAIEKPANQIECLGHGVGYSVGEIVKMFKEVNGIANIDLLTKIGPRRKGDIDYYVLKDVSPYMKNLYSMAELLKV